MAKVFERVDSAATRGARKQAAQSRGSMLKTIVEQEIGASRGRVTIYHDAQTEKPKIRVARKKK